MASGSFNKLGIFSPNRVKAVLKAASSDDESALKAALNNYDVNTVSSNGKTLLDFAVERGNKTALENLLKAGADVNLSKKSLLKASKRGYDDCVDVLLQAGADVNHKNSSGDTALHLASSKGHFQCSKSLLKKGAKVDAENEKGETAFARACRKGRRPCIVTLLESGADFISSHVKNVPQFVSYLESCADLLKTEGKINEKDCHGMTLLMYAASSLSVKCVTHLLHCGSDPDLQNKDLKTALMFAFCDCYYLSKLTFLNREAPVSTTFVKLLAGKSKAVTDDFCKTALMHALASKRPLDDGLIEYLAEGCVDFVDRFQKTALMYAIVNERELSECLITCLRGNTLDRQDSEGKTAVMLAGDKLSTRQFHFLLGTHVNAPDNMGRHALFYVKYNIELITECVRGGMDVNQRDYNGMTALMDALSHNPYLTHDAVQSLVGDTVTTKDKRGRSALMFARTTAHIAQLLELGFDVNLQDVDGRTPLMHGIMHRAESSVLELLVGEDVNVRDKQGRTALMYAVASVSIDFIKRIVGLGGDLNLQDSDGKTALMHAVLFFPHLTRELIEILRGDSINAMDKFGNTAFIHVVFTRHLTPETCQHFLELGANVNIPDVKNKTDLLKMIEPRPFRYFEQYYPWNNCFEVLNNRKTFPSEIINLGSTPSIHDVLKPHLKPTSVRLRQALNDLSVLRFLVCNSTLPYIADFEYSSHSPVSPLSVALQDFKIDAARYLIVNTVFIDGDFRRLQELLCSCCSLPEDVSLLITQAVSTPWPLVKLAFTTVSTLVGHSHERSGKINKLKLPKKIEDMLLYQSPISKIPVFDWHRIPLSFDLTVYENLPYPRPLLYQWPFGIDLVFTLNNTWPPYKYPLTK
ncbi:unnamed protein product [Lymnaea stagnalis]|uniref:Uncharacterized protein n=1 Tax=Lymnaea stagnalis TaxID=6523 RepID=A0AAV2HR57_LYMST